ncbi:MAG: hypothetical protein EOP10_05335 [Proteobacteria bacterium]|nr:MAG: hypothetical protein EOP10_05335 [Pseudomonadota bacterium]
MDYSLELTRPFRSLRIWLSLKQYGPAVFAEALREKYLLAEHCRAELLKVPGIRVFGSIDLSIFAFSIESEGGDQSESNRLTQRLLDSLNKTPDFFLSSTLIDGAFLIRVAILSFRTHIETVESLIRSVGVETQTLVKAGEL